MMHDTPNMGFPAKTSPSATFYQQFRSDGILERSAPSLFGGAATCWASDPRGDDTRMAPKLRIETGSNGLPDVNSEVGCVFVCDGKSVSSGVAERHVCPPGERIAVKVVGDRDCLAGTDTYDILETCAQLFGGVRSAMRS